MNQQQPDPRRRPCLMALAAGTILLILGLAGPAGAMDSADCLRLVGRWGYGPALAVAAEGNMAYFGSGAVLLAVEAHDPANSAIMGRLLLPGLVQGVAVRGNLLLVAAGEAGLVIVDAADPAHLQVLGLADTPGFARGVAYRGDLAYVADDSAGLRVFDIADPVRPFEIGSLDTAGHARGVAVFYPYAYVADGEAGLRVISIANPAAPRELGSCLTLDEARGVATAGVYAYVADWYGGLAVVNVMIPTAPFYAGTGETPDVAAGVAIAGTYACVADGYGGLRLLNISSPVRPVEAGFFDTAGTTVSVAAANGHAYVADGEGGLRVINITDPARPVEVRSMDTPGKAVDVDAVDSHAYVMDGYEGLRVIETVNPFHPAEISFFSLGGSAEGVTVTGDEAVVADGYAGFGLLDLADPAVPVLAGYRDTPGAAKKTAVVGGVAYVADGVRGLRIFDISQPSNLVELAQLEMPGTARGVAVMGNRAFVADGIQGVRVVDVTEPSHPVEIAVLDTPGSANAVAVSDDLAYVAAGRGGLRIYDLPGALPWREVGSYPTAGYAFDVAVDGPYAYLADGAGGLRVLDVLNPAQPILAGIFPTRGPARAVRAAGNYVYVAEEAGGLSILAGCVPGPGCPAVAVAALDVSGCPEIRVVAQVTDDAGQPVAGLPAADFVLREDGLDREFTLSPGAGTAFGPGRLGAGGTAVHQAGQPGMYEFRFATWGNDSQPRQLELGVTANRCTRFTGIEFQCAAPEPRRVLIADSSGPAGGLVQMPVRLESLGDESTLQFSVVFDPMRLNHPRATLGADAAGALLIVDDSQQAAGRLGLGIRLGSGQSFAPGTRELAGLAFDAVPGTIGSTTLVDFGDSPVTREVRNAAGNLLVEEWRAGTVTICAPPAARTLEARNSTAASARLSGLAGPNGYPAAAYFQWGASTAYGHETAPQPVGPSGMDIRFEAAPADLQPNTLYHFRAMVASCGGMASGSDQVFVSLDAPTQLRASLADPGQASLSWQDNSSGENGFHLERRAGLTGSWGMIAALGPNETSFIDSNLAAATTYFYHVAAFVAAGNSTWSNSATVNTGDYQLYLPAAAHTPGVNNTIWRSDVVLLNLGAAPAPVEVAVFPRDQANPVPATAAITVPPGGTFRLDDVLGSTFSVSNAALGFRFPEGPVKISSRFYNSSQSVGTNGMGIVAMGQDQALCGDEASLGVFGYLASSPAAGAGFRSNLGFVNASAFNVQVLIKLFGDTGELLAVRSHTLLPYEHRQFTRVYESFGVTAAVNNGFAVVEVLTSGGRVHAYAMVIDNESGDPLYWPLEIVSK